MFSTRFTVETADELVLATNPSVAGATVRLTELYGLDGVSTGVDEDGEDLSFPVSMTELASGTYSTTIMLLDVGVYWARFTINGVAQAPVLVRVVPSGWPVEDASAGTPYTIGAVLPTRPASVQLTITDGEGAEIGNDDTGTAINWPQAMTQVPGKTDSWYYDSVTFPEGGRVRLAITPPTSPTMNDVLTVYAAAAVDSGVISRFSGWNPDTGLVPSDWVSISYIRKWTRWSSSYVSDADIRELRRMAIETFISETNTWVPAWVGTWYGLRGQGRRLFVPAPIVLPAHGGIEPEVYYTEPNGSQADVSQIDNEDLIFRVGGLEAKQPWLEIVGGTWDPSLDVRIRATFGRTDIHGGSTKLKQTIVGLVRWHSLSLGADADQAREQSTLNRIGSESSRDMRVDYDSRAIGDGITGDRTIDKFLLEFRIEPGPWVRRGGDVDSSVAEEF